MDGNGETTIFYIKIWNHPIETSIYKWLALGFQGVNKLHPVAPLIFGPSLGVFFRLHVLHANVVLQRFSKSLRPHTSARWNSSCVMRQFRFGGGDVSGDAYPSRVLYLYTPFFLKKRGSLRIKTWSPFSQKPSPKFFFVGDLFRICSKLSKNFRMMHKIHIRMQKTKFQCEVGGSKTVKPTWVNTSFRGGICGVFLHVLRVCRHFLFFFWCWCWLLRVFLDKTQGSAGWMRRCVCFLFVVE